MDSIELYDQTIEECSSFPDQKEFFDCRFVSCHFQQAQMKSRKFHDCKFIDTNLSLVQVSNSTFRDCFFQNCKLLGTNWSGCFLVEHITIDSCLLNSSVWMNMRIKGFVSRCCQIREADFSGSDLTESVFDDCDLSETVFNETILKKADFTTSQNYLIHPMFNNIQGAKFSLPEAMGLLKSFDIDLQY